MKNQIDFVMSWKPNEQEQRMSYFIKELNRYHQEISKKDEKILKLETENKRIRAQLHKLESMITRFEEMGIQDDKNDEKKAPKKDKHEKLSKVIVELTYDTVYLHKRQKELKKILKLTQNRLHLMEKVIQKRKESKQGQTECRKCDLKEHCLQTKLIPKRYDKYSQTGPKEPEVAQNQEDRDSPDDDLISELFYLPTNPEIPDLKLFFNL